MNKDKFSTTTHTMAFIRSDFSPLFRLLDDYETHRSCPTRAVTKTATPTAHFTPSFDVRESSEGYYLDGELPGVDQSNIEIEFSDPQTLVVKGHTERNYQSQSQSPSETETEAEAESTPSPRRHQATVEDDEDEQIATSDTEVTAEAEAEAETEPTKQTTDLKAFHFWASERSIGEFQRTFTFPGRVDQDNVRANLKNGILSVYVPKDAAPKTKKIRILWGWSMIHFTDIWLMVETIQL